MSDLVLYVDIILGTTIIAAKIIKVGENVIGSNNTDTIIMIIHGTKNHSHPQKDGLTVTDSILF